MAYLVLNPEGEGRVFRLTEETCLGRDPKNDVRIDDMKVSRFHCRIERTSSGLFRLTDLESARGTKVNDERITDTLLHSGDRIRLGVSELVFQHTRPGFVQKRTGTRSWEVVSSRMRRTGEKRRRSKTQIPASAADEEPATDKRKRTGRPRSSTSSGERRRPSSVNRKRRPSETDPGDEETTKSGPRRSPSTISGDSSSSSRRRASASSSGLGQPPSIESDLQLLLERFKDLFGGEGVRRAEDVFRDFQKGTPTSRLNKLMAQKDQLMELMEINRALTTELELDRLLNNILDNIVHLVGAEQAFLIMFGADDEMEVKAHRNIQKETLVKPEKELSRGVIDKVRATGELVHSHDAVEEERFVAFASVNNLQLRSILCLPFKIDDRVIGALYVENRVKRQAFEDSDIEMIEAFGHQAAIAIRNAQQRSQILESNRALGILNQVGKAVSSTLDQDLLLELIVSKIIEVTQAQRVGLSLVDEDGKLDFRLGRDREQLPLTEEAFYVPKKLIRTALKKKKPITRDEARDGATLVVPLIARGKERLGILFADNASNAGPFSEFDSDLIAQIADTAAMAIYNAQLYQKATFDTMTAVYKRSYFDQRLREEVHRAKRYDTPLALLMLDLDHFKQLNDTYGHLAGDEVLRLVGKILKRNIRGSDLAARYGGEEFAIIMPQIDLASAVKVAKRIKRSIQNQSQLPYDISASIGAAEFKAKFSCENFIEKADRALYRAKQTGRNKVCVWRMSSTPSLKKAL